MRRFGLVLLVICALGGPALAERRVALVLGVETYRGLRPLNNPVNDALSVKTLLQDLDFEVYLETNRDLRRMRRALEDFAEDGAGADLALVFFAGHGVEIGGRNLLLPVDAGAESAEALKAGGLPLDEVAEVLRQIAPASIVLVDACRDDPFAGGGSGDGRGAVALGAALPGVSAGFGRMGQAEGLVFAFAAAPGATASDGTGANSPFTEALARHLATPGVEVRSALTLVQQDVYDRTRGAQLPYVESGLPRLVYARPGAGEGDLPERERLLLAMANLTPDLRHEIEDLARDRDMPLAPLYAAMLSADLAGAGASERKARLTEAAEGFARFQADLRRFASTDPQVQALRDAAEAELALGAIDTARRKLAEAAALDADSRDAARDTFVARSLSQAETLRLAASVALADLRYELALEDMRAALAIWAEVEPLGIGQDQALSRTKTLWDMGELHLQLGDNEAAMKAFSEWQRLAAARVAQNPEVPAFLRDEAAARSLMGNVMVLRGDLDGALAAYEGSREIFVRLVEMEPDTLLWQRDVAAADVLLGDFRLRARDFSGAVQAFSDSRSTLAALVAQSPDRLDWQSDLIATEVRLVSALMWTEDLDLAATMLDAAEARAEALIRAEPASSQRARQRFEIWQWRANLALRRGDLDQAEAAQLAGAAVLDTALVRDPRNVDLRNARADLDFSIAERLMTQGRAAEAAPAYRAARLVAQDVAARDPQNLALAERVLWLMAREGWARQAAGDAQAATLWAEALSWADNALALWPDHPSLAMAQAITRHGLASAGIEPRANLGAAQSVMRDLDRGGKITEDWQREWVQVVDEALEALP